MNRSQRLALLFAFTSLSLCIGGADASVSISVFESGNDVIAEGSGTLNLSALTFDSQSFNWVDTGFINPGSAVIIIGDSLPADTYTGVLDSPTQLGDGALVVAGDFASGDFIRASLIPGGGGTPDPQITVPGGYVSGDFIEGFARWDNASLSSLGLTEGRYVWSWGVGADSDSIILSIGSIPEPASATVLASGMLALFVRRRRQ